MHRSFPGPPEPRFVPARRTPALGRGPGAVRAVAEAAQDAVMEFLCRKRRMDREPEPRRGRNDGRRAPTAP